MTSDDLEQPRRFGCLGVFWLYLAIDLIEGKARLVTGPVTRQVAMDTYDDEGKALLPK